MSRAIRPALESAESGARSSTRSEDAIPSSSSASHVQAADSSTPSNVREPAFAVRFPFRTVSELNRRGHEHWRVTHKRASEQKWLTTWILGWKRREYRFPVTVKLTRLAPRKLDEGDNLNASFKSIRDAIAKWLGVNDGDTSRVVWTYAQERSKTYGVRFELFEADA